MSATAHDRAAVARLLGRSPMGEFRVVVRDVAGEPAVIENAPFLDDGTPMPTRFWLCGSLERRLIGRLESRRGVRRAEEAIGLDRIADAHRRYAAQRDQRIPADWAGARPSGGVGGTRVGVKCLHAHYAWYLAGGDDPVGEWAAAHLYEASGEAPLPLEGRP